jgi:hypothetical protein
MSYILVKGKNEAFTTEGPGAEKWKGNEERRKADDFKTKKKKWEE